MNCIEIVKQYLKEHGYDGLCDIFCGCAIGDLTPCGNISNDCKPGYKVLCVNCKEKCSEYPDEIFCIKGSK
jgi:hypothetical protein